MQPEFGLRESDSSIKLYIIKQAETNSRNGSFDVGWTMISMPPFNLMEISSRKYIAKILKVKEKSQEASSELVIYIQTMKSNLKKIHRGNNNNTMRGL